MDFVFNAIGTFEAKNLKDAFRKLSLHFSALADKGHDAPYLFDTGGMSLEARKEVISVPCSGKPKKPPKKG